MKMGLRSKRKLRTLNRMNCSGKPLKIESLGQGEKEGRNKLRGQQERWGFCCVWKVKDRWQSGRDWVRAAVWIQIFVLASKARDVLMLIISSKIQL
jgi:hypothetical protein